MDRRQYWEKIYDKQDELNSLITSYWNKFSSVGDWQFWLAVSMLIVPLIFLYFFLDRRRLFEILFFGYTIHILWSYFIIAMGTKGYFVHYYFLTPLLPHGINVSASMLPVGFLLLYQYCTNRNKNFFLYTLLLSAVFAFGFATVEKSMGFVEFRKGTHQFHLFLIDVVIVFISYWMTKILKKVQKTN
ncbi:hypothetical protein [Litchfieldia salsa]|uniref:Uncharacterized protein n=1 Tax=Litchfieldia salsa TaxID=930152 RepID=A0A1H0PPK3_9BACI|nr:hypothetical protein [Litchfieldia salsa]SDP07091.1 hypothetical protein SAMN05216565_101416 [Litchfieldia salsa]